MSECDSVSRTVRRKGMQDTRREIPAYADPVCRFPPKPTEIPLQVIPRKIINSGIGALEQDINMDFEDKSTYQEGVIPGTYQRPDYCRVYGQLNKFTLYPLNTLLFAQNYLHIFLSSREN